MDEDGCAQENELLALESIFGGGEDVLKIETIEGDVPYKSGHLKICLNTDAPRIKVSVFYADSNVKSVGESSKPEDSLHQLSASHTVEFLPPINLNFILPTNYPSVEAPRIQLVCKWLDRSQLTTLCKKLDEIWKEQEGQEVLYTWYQFLKEESLNILGFHEEISIHQDNFSTTRKKQNLEPRVIQDVEYFSEILPEILRHNETQIKRTFENSVFSCNVCFNEKYGRDCLQFRECKHVYCRECITSYFDIQIKEGNVKALTCPEPKCGSQAYPGQVKELVGPDEFSRYETLLLQTTLDMMSDVMYCPRKYCQAAVVVEEDIGICSVCKFSFCPYCKLAYHGLAPCRLCLLNFQKFFLLSWNQVFVLLQTLHAYPFVVK